MDYAVSRAKVKGSAVTMCRSVSINKSDRFLRLNRKHIHRVGCEMLRTHTMPSSENARFKSEKADSTVFV